jgi:hypothetical protein
VHPQAIGPLLFIAEGVEAEYFAAFFDADLLVAAVVVVGAVGTAIGAIGGQYACGYREDYNYGCGLESS